MSTSTKAIQYTKSTHAAKALGVSTDFLRKCARLGELPDGAVIATNGGQYSYDLEAVRNWMLENYKRQTRTARLEAKAAKK